MQIKMKEKNYMINSTDTEKAFEKKNQHFFFMIKTFVKLG